MNQAELDAKLTDLERTAAALARGTPAFTSACIFVNTYRGSSQSRDAGECAKLARIADGAIAELQAGAIELRLTDPARVEQSTVKSVRRGLDLPG